MCFLGVFHDLDECENNNPTYIDHRYYTDHAISGTGEALCTPCLEAFFALFFVKIRSLLTLEISVSANLL